MSLVVSVNGQTRIFDETFTIGRPGRGADLELDDEYASTIHARITHVMGSLWAVEDMGSTNGTYLDGHKIWSPFPLDKGSKVRVGRTILMVVPIA